MKRPLFVLGFAFGGCLLVARLAGFHVALIAAALGALLFVLALSVRSLRGNAALLAALLSAVAAFSIFSAREYLLVRPLHQLDGQTVTATVWLTGEVAKTDRSHLYSARVEAGDLPKDTRLLLWVTDAQDAPELYNLATASLRLTATDDARADGVYLTAWAEDGWTVTVTDRRPWNAGLTAWRESVTAHIDERVSGEVAALIRAVCFGDKSGLSAGTIDAFSDAGLSHLMAVSGFHMSAVALGFFGLLCVCGLRRRVAALLSLPVPMLFAALTGFSYSALRAGIMCLLVMLAAMTGRRADAKNSLGGAVLLIVLVDPNAIYDLGFLLSVTATLGIVCAAAWGRSPQTAVNASLPRRAGTRLWAAVRVTLAATIATLPILALTFERLSVLSPVSNLLGEPAAAGIVVCGCVGTLLLTVPGLSFLASPLLLAAGLLARGLLWWAKWVSSLPMAVFLLNHPYRLLWACAVPFALILGWRLLRGRGLRITAMLLVVALTAAMLANTLGMRGVTTLAATNLSDGAALLLTRDGHHGLVLTGSSTKEVASVLRQQGIDQLDFVLYTEKEDVAPDEISAACVLAPADGDGVTRLDETAAVAFWNDSTARWREGWLILTLGGTRVLVCSSDGDAATLPAEERWADWLIFDGTPPLHVTSIAAGQAVLCCAVEEMSAVTKAMPWGVYPIAVAADDPVTMRTRG